MADRTAISKSEDRNYYTNNSENKCHRGVWRPNTAHYLDLEYGQGDEFQKCTLLGSPLMCRLLGEGKKSHLVSNKNLGISHGRNQE